MDRAVRLESLRQRAEDALRELPEQARPVEGDAAGLARLIEELRVYQVELEIQNEELQAAQQRAELASARHQQLFQHMPLPALVLDKAGHIHDHNHLAQSWLSERTSFVPTDARLMRALNQSSRACLWKALNNTDTRHEHVLRGLVLKTPDHPGRHIDIHLLRLPDSYHIDYRVLALLTDRTTDVAISAQKQLFQTLIDSSDDLIFSTDRHGRFTLANQALLNALEKDMPSLLGQPRDTVMSVRDAIAHEISDQAVLRNRQMLDMKEEVFIPRHGETRFFTTHKFPLLNADGIITGIGGISRDITADRHNAYKQTLSEAVFLNATEAVIVTDADTRILRVNPAFEHMSGFSASTVVGRKTSMLRSGRQTADVYQDMWRCIKESGRWQGELSNRHATGLFYTVMSTITALHADNGTVTGYMAVQTDISRLLSAENEVVRLSYIDTLTSLPNRALLTDRLNQLLAHAKRHGEPFSVLFSDIDHFKSVNDSMGHGVGDALLVGVAQRLRAGVREQDTVARLGGDEFVVLLPQTSGDAALTLANKLLHDAQQPMQLGTVKGYQPHLSVGLAVFPDDGDTAELLLRNADTAMYAAKTSGRGRVRAYQLHMSEENNRVFDIRNGLSNALVEGEFRLFLQPKFRLRDMALAGAEALVRWERPGLGLTMPADFIAVAEKTGLLVGIDQWMLHEVAQVLARWTQQGRWPTGCHIAVNQAASDLEKPQWLPYVAAQIKNLDIEPAMLQIELTESDLLQPSTDMLVKLNSLRTLGIGLAIDDFGTGYSSLSYLKSLPISVIKIDQSFVRDMLTDTNDRTLVEAMVSLAHKLGHSLVAEGVETRQQADMLAALGCEAAQGYLVSPPVSVTEFETRFLPQMASDGSDESGTSQP